jgi:hypothetical protein
VLRYPVASQRQPAARYSKGTFTQTLPEVISPIFRQYAHSKII